MISFRIGGLITGIIGILIQPWRLLANASVYIDKWLIGYSLLLGRRRRRADRRLLRHPPHASSIRPGCIAKTGPIGTAGGFNPIAIFALLCGIGLCIPGFLAAVGKIFALQSQADAPSDLIRIPDCWGQIYSFAWFVSFGVSFLMYAVLMLLLAQADRALDGGGALRSPG